MSLTVEDGTGLAAAESYVSVAEADSYFASHPNATWAAITGGSATTTKENALRLATQYADAQYGGRWQGVRLYPITQRLDFPRWGVFIDRFMLQPAPLPVYLKEAICELAVRAIAGDLAPDIDGPGLILSEMTKVGPIEESTTYAGGKSQIAWFRKVDLLLAKILQDPGLQRA